MKRREVLALAAFLVTLCFLPGCGNSYSKYIPESKSAEAALIKCLEAWKGGAKFKSFQWESTDINIFDGRWRDGKKLESFEVVDEVKKAERPTFKVKMKLADEDEATITYYVIGNNPLNVFRDKDFEQAKTW